MPNHSPKVIEFLKKNPSFEHYEEIYKKIKQTDTKVFRSISENTTKQIEEKLGQKVNINNLEASISVAKKLNSPDEFLTWIAGDMENLPALQLNQAEMAVINGGLSMFWGAVSANRQTARQAADPLYIATISIPCNEG